MSHVDIFTTFEFLIIVGYFDSCFIVDIHWGWVVRIAGGKIMSGMFLL